jgi:hypothetical protein
MVTAIPLSRSFSKSEPDRPEDVEANKSPAAAVSEAGTERDRFADCPGRVRQSRDFILRHCIKICEDYPWWDFDSVLDKAKEYACNADRLFNPDLGSWETFLGYHLRALIGFAERKDADDDGATRAQWERAQVHLGSNLYEWDDGMRLANSLQRWWEGSSFKRRRRRMRKPNFPDGDGTRVVFYSADGFTAFRLGFRVNHDDLSALLLRGLMPAVGDIDRYHYEPAQPKPSLRARRITKGWGLNGRAAHMDTVLIEAAHDIEDSLTEQEVPVFIG